MRGYRPSETTAYMEWLYREYHSYMFRVAWQYAEDKPTVEDVVADVCVALARKVSVLRRLEEPVLRAYIAAAVRNTALNSRAVRNRTRSMFASLDDEPERGDSGDAEQRIDMRLQLEDVYAAIRKLPEKERLILLLKFRMEWSNGRIAKYLGISPNSIGKYVRRGREHLLRLMEEDGNRP